MHNKPRYDYKCCSDVKISEQLKKKEYVSEDRNSTSDLCRHLEAKTNDTSVSFQSLFNARQTLGVLENGGLLLKTAFLLQILRQIVEYSSEISIMLQICMDIKDKRLKSYLIRHGSKLLMFQ